MKPESYDFEKLRRFDMKRMQPSNGCENCGAFSDESPGVLRKKLVFCDGAWLCSDCRESACSGKSDGAS
jgi:hypothetical protein